MQKSFEESSDSANYGVLEIWLLIGIKAIIFM